MQQPIVPGKAVRESGESPEEVVGSTIINIEVDHQPEEETEPTAPAPSTVALYLSLGGSPSPSIFDAPPKQKALYNNDDDDDRIMSSPTLYIASCPKKEGGKGASFVE